MVWVSPHSTKFVVISCHSKSSYLNKENVKWEFKTLVVYEHQYWCMDDLIQYIFETSKKRKMFVNTCYMSIYDGQKINSGNENPTIRANWLSYCKILSLIEFYGMILINYNTILKRLFLIYESFWALHHGQSKFDQKICLFSKSNRRQATIAVSRR